MDDTRPAGRRLSMGEPVRAADLERILAGLCDTAPGQAEGMFGPGSTIWQVDREAAIFLGAGRALLLQIAHPWVAEAVSAHSRFLADPVGRFHRTFATTFALVFGTRDQAIAAARALHRRHESVGGRLTEAAGLFAAGTAYQANEVAALRWVWATLADTALLAHDIVLPLLDAAARARYYDDHLRFAALFGLPRETLPPDWDAFAAYTGGMLAGPGTLAVTGAARRIAEGLLSGVGRWWLRAPDWYRALTAEMLPPWLREEFGLPYGPGERRMAWRAALWLRRSYGLLPARVRHVGPYQEAEARLCGRPAPDAVTRALNRLWIGQPRLGR